MPEDTYPVPVAPTLTTVNTSKPPTPEAKVKSNHKVRNIILVVIIVIVTFIGGSVLYIYLSLKNIESQFSKCWEKSIADVEKKIKENEFTKFTIKSTDNNCVKNVYSSNQGFDRKTLEEMDQSAQTKLLNKLFKAKQN